MIVSATESGCEDVVSTTVTVIVEDDIAIDAQPVGGSICEGGTWDLSVTASGSPGLHYEWQWDNAGTWTVVGTDQNTYNTGALTSTQSYRVIVSATEAGCEDVVSTTVTVTVEGDIAIDAQPVGGSICEGGYFDLSVAASGSPGLHYEWQWDNAGTWTVVGTDQNTYNTGALTSTQSYRVIVSATESGCEDVVSTTVTVIVEDDIAIDAQPVGGSICEGGDVDLSVTASGSPGLHYEWQWDNAGTWTVVGTNQNTYNTGALTSTQSYRVIVSATEAGCEDVISTTVTVTVEDDIAIDAQPAGGSICEGGELNLSVLASGSPGLHYEWQWDNAGTWIVVGSDQYAYNTGELSATQAYRVVVSADESAVKM